MRVLVGVVPMAGHVGPVTGLVAELVRRGHEVRVHTGARYAERFARLGAQPLPWSAARDFDEEQPAVAFPDVRGGSTRRSLALVRDAFLGTATGQVADLEVSLAVEPADVVVGEVFTLGPGLVAARHGLPWASVNALPPNVLSQELPPPGLNVAPARGPLGRHRDQGLRKGFEILTGGLNRRYLAIRAELGLELVPGPFGSAFYSPWLSLLTGAPSLEHARHDLPDTMHFVGRLPVAGRTASDVGPGARPLVVVTQGTHNVDPRDLLRPAAAALASLPVDVLVTTGRRGVSSLGVAVPDNVSVVDFVDFGAVLGRTAVFVANGGWGALLEALAAGVPVVVAGGDIDKPENARRVARVGAGIDLRTGRPRPAAIADAVAEVLADPAYRDRAQAVATELAALGGAARAADLIEELATTRAPVRRLTDPWASSAPTPTTRSTAGALEGRAVLAGQAAGEVLYSDVPLSFMGGIDPETGVIIDKHHPLLGACVAGRILALPSGRGSCSGSGVMLELLVNGHAPAALVCCYPEPILTLGVLIGAELFDRGIPQLHLDPDDFAALAGLGWARVEGDRIVAADPGPVRSSFALPELDLTGFRLSERDRAALAGAEGEASRIATRIVIRAAQQEGAEDLIDIELGHIDGCFYQGPASLALAERLRDLGGRVRVPTTMNALRVDRRRWRDQGVPAALGEPSDALADALVAMGVQPSYTCAPYLLAKPPVLGQQIAWAESNAVMFANAVLGARTMKYPDYLDLLVALTGRAPNAGCHLPAHRRAAVQVDVTVPDGADDSFYPLLGYHVGLAVPHDIPVLTGLESAGPSRDDLKAFGAAFATTSAAPMFHVVGVTPEAVSLEEALTRSGPVERLAVGATDLAGTWAELNTATDPTTDLIALGNPHFSATEFARLAALCRGRTKQARVRMVVTCNRHTSSEVEESGDLATLVEFGAEVLTDTCWCLVDDTILAGSSRAITTTSAKYAHYGVAATPRGFHFRSLGEAVDAACTGRVAATRPAWLGDH